MFISAHTKYSERYIEPLVPGAEHVTVLRSPSNHFLSSWNYWGVPEHMKTKSGDSVTVDQLLDNPKEYWSKGPALNRSLYKKKLFVEETSDEKTGLRMSCANQLVFILKISVN